LRPEQPETDAMAVKSVTTATFRQEVMESELPVLVDLWAEWCAPCRQLSPRVEEVAREMEGRIKVVKVNVDQNPELAQAFNARNIPMLVVIVNGRPAKSAQGALSKKEILDLVEPFLPVNEDEVPAKDLPALMKARRVTVVDVRDAAVFNRAHIPGAWSLPAATITDAVPTLARERRAVVLYDRAGGDDCKKAMEALVAQGLPAAYLKGGFLAWEAEGFEVERPD
jgi:thioredoxin 1/putative thioredoxin